MGSECRSKTAVRLEGMDGTPRSREPTPLRGGDDNEQRNLEPDHACGLPPPTRLTKHPSQSSIGICRTPSRTPPHRPPLGFEGQVYWRHSTFRRPKLLRKISYLGAGNRASRPHSPSPDVEPACIPFQEDLCDPRRTGCSGIYPR